MQAVPFSRLAAVVAGNALEFYDFLIFGFFAVQIGQAFFPAAGPDSGLLLTLATFGVGFLTRPLGGVVIGSLGDRAGRKPAMFLSFGLMGVSIIGLALTPSYARIGIAAPLLVVMFRLLQGFALGGEVGPSTAYLMEAAPAGKRGLYVSLQFATQQAAIMTAGLVGVFLSGLMSPAALASYGWRIAMLVGAAIVPFGLVMRARLPETFSKRSAAALPRLTANETWLALIAFFLLANTTISTYVMNYLTTFGNHTLGLSPGIAFSATVATGLCGTIFNPLGGMLADRFGFRRVMLTFLLLQLVTTLPCFMAMASLKNAFALDAGAALMGTLLALATPSAMLALSEGLPAAIRSGGIGTVYALAISIFGGSAQFVVAWLTGLLHSPLVPGFYMSGALLAGITARLLLPPKADA
jgi:MFS family permease